MENSIETPHEIANIIHDEKIIQQMFAKEEIQQKNFTLLSNVTKKTKELRKENEEMEIKVLELNEILDKLTVELGDCKEELNFTKTENKVLKDMLKVAEKEGEELEEQLEELEEKGYEIKENYIKTINEKAIEIKNKQAKPEDIKYLKGLISGTIGLPEKKDTDIKDEEMISFMDEFEKSTQQNYLPKTSISSTNNIKSYTDYKSIASNKCLSQAHPQQSTATTSASSLNKSTTSFYPNKTKPHQEFSQSKRYEPNFDSLDARKEPSSFCSEISTSKETYSHLYSGPSSYDVDTNEGNHDYTTRNESSIYCPENESSANTIYSKNTYTTNYPSIHKPSTSKGPSSYKGNICNTINKEETPHYFNKPLNTKGSNAYYTGKKTEQNPYYLGINEPSTSKRSTSYYPGNKSIINNEATPYYLGINKPSTSTGSTSYYPGNNTTISNEPTPYYLGITETATTNSNKNDRKIFKPKQPSTFNYSK